MSLQHQEAHRGCDPIPAWRNSDRDPGLNSNPGTGNSTHSNLMLFQNIVSHLHRDEDDLIFDTVGKISLCFLGNRKQNTSGPCRGGPSETLKLQRR